MRTSERRVDCVTAASDGFSARCTHSWTVYTTCCDWASAVCASDRRKTATVAHGLQIGNIAAGVDQCVVKVTHTTMLTGWSFVLSKAFGKVGAITALDLPFHHSGPSKGKLRGYAFVEYASAEVHEQRACHGS